MDSLYGPELDQQEPPASVFDYQDTPENTSWAGTLPLKQALYDPELEKDACGVGFAAYSLPTCFVPFRPSTDSDPGTSKAWRATRS